MISTTVSSTAIFVPIDLETTSKLLSKRRHGESLSGVVARLCESGGSTEREAVVQTSGVEVNVGNYTAMFLGEPIHAETLPELFARVVDLSFELDPASIERLASMKARTRRYVSRKREAIHPGRPDLPVTRTCTGWWISANVGVEDIVRSLRALADAAKLDFGTDIRFPTNAK
ncbi:hypothetical protein [Ruegeria sp. HKCCA0235A]|uniref:hypothetical protein n=1 Tax=Ruegeria sp. HKCCA0235A TaxID=2682998 RepID=UPI0014893E25|nr:hypothetical protein [Ruegeria sp. HKCCA0235A]